MRHSRAIGRAFALGAVVIALAVVSVVLLRSGSGDYTVTARFINASQLVKGNLVQVSGRAVGKVTEIDLTDDGQAEVTMRITDDGYAPLRRGTTADRPTGLAVRRREPLHRPSSRLRAAAQRSPTAARCSRPRRPPPSTSTSSSTPSTPTRARACSRSSRDSAPRTRARASWPTAAGCTSTRRSPRRAGCSRSSTATPRCCGASSSRRRSSSPTSRTAATTSPG